tara:strand:- start:631 stop:1083 length:453 start_codon:yes stop_codon:yes gene_type:complete
MKILDLIKNSKQKETPTVLYPIWTKDPDLCCKSMCDRGHQMLSDMVECQDLIAALDIAAKNKIEIPKLSATFYKQGEDGAIFDGIHVNIESKVPEDFAQLLWSIQDGTDVYGLSYREKTSEYCTSIRSTDKMKQYIKSIEDNLNIINSTL